MAHTYVRIITHVVFGTKGRKPTIHTAMRERLHAYLAGVIKNCGGKPICVGGTDDHVHLLFEPPSNQLLSQTVCKIKANSSKWIHETFADSSTFEWQNGYAAISVSPSAVDRLVAYIENQEAHHRKRSFDEELVLLLARCGVVYDERYVHG